MVSLISCPEVNDSGSSDKVTSFTHNFNDLHEIRLKNTNTLRNKFEMLREVIGNSVDILLISEKYYRKLSY